MGVPVVVVIIVILAAIVIVAIVIGVLVWKKKAGSYKKHEDDTAMSIKDNEIDESIAEKMWRSGNSANMHNYSAEQ